MGPTLSTDEELSKYPEDARELLRATEQAAVDRWLYHTEEYSHREPRAYGGYTFYDKSGRVMTDKPISSYFSLSYASWLTIPRMSLEEMPLDWQARFVALMEEAHYEHKLKVPDGLYVTRKVSGKYVKNDHWNNYRRGSVREALEVDLSQGYITPKDLRGYVVTE